MLYKRLIKWLVIALGILLLVLTGGYGALRLNDGPVEFFPWFTISIGGPFRSGEMTESPDDWNFIRDREEIEIQTFAPRTSRTVWVPVIDGQLYIVSGYMNSTVGRLWKQWPSYLEEDNRVLIRVDGKIYQQRLERITGGPIAAEVMSEIARKYFGGPAQTNSAADQGVTSGSVWLFAVVEP